MEGDEVFGKVLMNENGVWYDEEEICNLCDNFVCM